MTSSYIFITNFDSRMDQALHQLRGVNAHEESSLASIWSEERKDKKRRREGEREKESRKRKERGEKKENIVKVQSPLEPNRQPRKMVWLE